MHPLIEERLQQVYKDDAKKVLLNAILQKEIQEELETDEKDIHAKYKDFCKENMEQPFYELLSNADVSVCCALLLYMKLVELKPEERNVLHQVRIKRNDIAHAMNMRIDIQQQSSLEDNRGTLLKLRDVFSAFNYFFIKESPFIIDLSYQLTIIITWKKSKNSF